MKLAEVKAILGKNSERKLKFILPTGTSIPLHAHVTDIARVDKKFIDCGGAVRSESFCRLQTWFADDTDHRIGAEMLLKILGKASSFLESDDLEVDVEYEAPFVSQFPIASIEAEGEHLVIRLGIRHTACLAEDRCLTPSRTKEMTLLGRPLKSLQTVKCCWNICRKRSRPY